MIKNTVSLDDAIEYLNSLVEIDALAMAAIISNRVPCNQAMADHPTVQVHAYQKEEGYKVGFLGLLNGLFGVDESGYGDIAAIFDERDLKYFVRFSKKDPDLVLPIEIQEGEA